MAQVWLITGSSRGLGRAIVEAGLLAGNKVLATARDIESLRELSERYRAQVKLFELDVTNESSAAGAVKTAINAFGSLDVVINNAGYGNLSSVEDTPISDFRAQIETNLFGTIIVTKAVLPYFRERKAGQFIQFSSMGGRIGPPGRGPYSAAKWGVEGFSEVLSREVAPLGIKVTIVEPGGFRTDFAGSSTKLSEGHPEYDSTVGATARFQRAYNGKQPGDPKKAAQAIVRLTQEQKPPLRLWPRFSSTASCRRRPQASKTARSARSRFFFKRSPPGACQSLCDCSALNQFPSLTPIFLAPFTRRMPAARSGLRRPQSAAS